MEFDYQEGLKTIRFKTRLKQDDCLDNLAFALLVASKFEGTAQRAVKYWENMDGYPRLIITVCVVFPDYLDFANARAHSNRNLDANGAILADYVGALESFDPARRAAEALRERARKAGSRP